MTEEREPKVGDMVHYMAGDADCAAVITTLAYHRAMPPNTVEINPMIYQPKQALLILASMQQPYWTQGSYSEDCEPGTWHWPSLHDPPPPEVTPPPPPLYIGMIVHFANPPWLHQPAIVTGVIGNNVVDLAIMNSDKRRVDFAFNVPPDSAYDFKINTWHRIRSDEYAAPFDAIVDAMFSYVEGIGPA